MSNAILQASEEKMKKSLSSFEGELSTIRAGRANPHVLDRLMVSYYGQMTPVAQLSNITVPEARIIQIQPWEANMVKEIEKAIQVSDIGINPTNDGKVIRLVFPELTEERRKDLTKEIKKKGEDAKVAIRNIRRDAVDAAKKAQKANEITEDDLKNVETNIQKITDKFIENIDGLVDKKSKEILSV